MFDVESTLIWQIALYKETRFKLLIAMDIIEIVKVVKCIFLYQSTKKKSKKKRDSYFMITCVEENLENKSKTILYRSVSRHFDFDFYETEEEEEGEKEKKKDIHI